MRCFFHLVNAREIVPDTSGIDVVDVELGRVRLLAADPGAQVFTEPTRCVEVQEAGALRVRSRKGVNDAGLERITHVPDRPGHDLRY